MIHSFLGKDNLFQNKWKCLHKGVNIREWDGWKTASSLPLRKGEPTGSGGGRFWAEVILSQSMSLTTTSVYTMGSPPGDPTSQHWDQRGPCILHRPMRSGPHTYSREKGKSIVWLGSPVHKLGQWRMARTLQHVDWREKQRNSNSPKAKCKKTDR